MRRHLSKTPPLKAYEQQKLERGEWLGSYPMGYAYKIGPKLKYSRMATVWVDEKESSIIKEIFTLYARGHISLLNLSKLISDKYSINIGRAQVHRILKNEFYIGIMIWKGHTYPHKYPTFIEKEIFEQAQKVMAFNNKHILYGQKFQVYPAGKTKVDDYRTKDPKNIYEQILQLCKEPCSTEKLAELTGLSIRNVQSILLDMEIEGRIRDNGSGFWFAP